MTPRVRGVRAGIAMLVGFACAVSPARAQELGGPYGRVATSRHGVGTMVAVALRLPAGSREDAPGYGGTAWLLAHVLARQAEAALDPGEAGLTVQVGRTSTLFTLLAVPGSWRSSWAVVDSVLFRAPINADALASERRELVRRLDFLHGSPERDFDREVTLHLAGPGDPWARPVEGTPESIAAASVASLAHYRSEHYEARRAAVALVGPIGSGPVPRGVDTLPVPARPGIAWQTGRRTVEIQDVTSTWLAVAYPAPADVSRTALEMLASLIHTQLDPTPPDPDQYDIDVRIEGVPGGPVLLVEATVFPDAADRWEKRILGAVNDLTHERMQDELFRWRRRRFRTERLLAEAAPEAEAARMTADLLREGRVRDLDTQTWTLTADTLLAAARSLGPPRILLLGPDLGRRDRRR